MRRFPIVLVAALALSPVAAAKTTAEAVETNWRRVATPADIKRLHDWREAFVQGLAEARAAGHGAEVRAAGRLLEPDAALDNAALPVGTYRCRMIKLGAQGAGGLAFVAYPAFTCRVTADGALSGFVRLDGSQRPNGLLYVPTTRQQVFLGTLVLGDETRALNYGRDTDRDMIGAVERIGAARWRLVLPYPRFESKLDVMELVPVS